MRQVRRRTVAGRWHRVFGAGLATHAGPFCELERARAIQLTWNGAVTSHRSAAILHGFPIRSDGLTYVLAGRGHRVPQGVRRYVAVAGAADVVALDGLLVTNRVRSATDCLASLDCDEALDLFAWLSTRRVLDRAALAFAARSRFGRPGTPALLDLLVETRTGAVSHAELLLHRILDHAGVRGWTANVPVNDSDGVIGVVDVLFQGERVVLEVDGRRSHDNPEAFVRDRRRQNRLVMAGYLVLRFTWDDLAHRADAVLRQILAALGARATAGRPS